MPWPEELERVLLTQVQMCIRDRSIPTQYDREGDPLSRDVSLFLAVADAFAEPRIHRAMPGGIYDLEVYRQEVVNGRCV